MQDSAEKQEEIFQALHACAIEMAEKCQVGESELKRWAKMLLRHHSPELFKIIWGIPNSGFFPTFSILEIKACEALGKGLGGKVLTYEMIEENARALMAAGVSKENAEAGANFMKKILFPELYQKYLVEKQKPEVIHNGEVPKKEDDFGDFGELDISDKYTNNSLDDDFEF